MKVLLASLVLSVLASCVYAWEPVYTTPLPLLAQAEPRKPVDMRTAETRTMTLYEQGWEEGAERGDNRAGKIGWFFAGFGNVPFLWLPWVVEPRRPAKPPVVAEEEFNSGYRNGYRAGWKNAHKTWYIVGVVVSSAAAGAAILAAD